MKFLFLYNTDWRARVPGRRGARCCSWFYRPYTTWTLCVILAFDGTFRSKVWATSVGPYSGIICFQASFFFCIPFWTIHLLILYIIVIIFFDLCIKFISTFPIVQFWYRLIAWYVMHSSRDSWLPLKDFSSAVFS